MTFDKPHADPSYLISSYVYRKALIRKHQLHTTITEYLAKTSHRGLESILAQPKTGGVGGIPKGWIIDIQFADELDELIMDDLYDLNEAMQRNESGEGETQWFILKPGFADRAQGIRMFSTEEELYVPLLSSLTCRRAIFEEFEPPSDDEEDEEEEEDEEGLARKTDQMGLSDESDGEGGTAVMTSHLRHFVIQVGFDRVRD